MLSNGIHAAIVVWSRTWRGPVKRALRLRDRQVIDAGFSPPHEAIAPELPQLVAISAKPLTRLIMILVAEAHRDAMVGKAP